MVRGTLHWGFTAYRILMRHGKPTPCEVPITINWRYVYTNEHGYTKKFDKRTGVIVHDCAVDWRGYADRIYPTKDHAQRSIQMWEAEKIIREAKEQQ